MKTLSAALVAPAEDAPGRKGKAKKPATVATTTKKKPGVRAPAKKEPATAAKNKPAAKKP